MTLNICRGSQKRIDELCVKCKLDPLVFKGWIQDVQFELQEKPDEKLKYIEGEDPYHEYTIIQTHENRRFVTVWELEREGDDFHVLDVHCLNEHPFLAEND